MEYFTHVPPAAVTRVLSTFGRRQLEGFVAVAIDLLDLADGDTDREDNGLEDDFLPHPSDGPGCPIDDPGGHSWLDRRDQSKQPYGIGTHAHFQNDEDAEEDDPHGEITEDEPAFDKRSRRIANRGEIGAGDPLAGDLELNGDEGDHSR